MFGRLKDKESAAVLIISLICCLNWERSSDRSWNCCFSCSVCCPQLFRWRERPGQCSHRTPGPWPDHPALTQSLGSSSINQYRSLPASSTASGHSELVGRSLCRTTSDLCKIVMGDNSTGLTRQWPHQRSVTTLQHRQLHSPNHVKLNEKPSSKIFQN